MAERPKIDLGLTGYDELFMDDKERQEMRLPRIHEIPLELIDDFPGHPYQVRMDEDMDQLVESIKERGIITPVTLRPKDDGRYEMVSGMTMIKADVREMSRDDAIILMVESNLQRSVILPSEKAFSYKMRLEAMSRQGKRTDLTCGPVGHKSDGTKSRDLVAEGTNDSARQVSRYIRLTYLIPEILQMVDEGKIAFRPAVEISYLTQDEQKLLLEGMEYADATPSLAQAIKLKSLSNSGSLDYDAIEDMLSEENEALMYRMMTTLNKAARDAMVKYDVHACTDVTGFGLLGHAYEMATGSDTTITLHVDAIDLIPEALELARMGFLPAGMYRNRTFAEMGVDAGDVELAKQDLLYDPQTAGGLMIAVAEQDADALYAELQKTVPSAQRIGTVASYEGGKRIILR